MAALSSLNVDRSLLDAEFDGYKLSLEPFATYKVSLDKDVDEAVLGQDQYSYQHVKAFGRHNHLCPDPCHPENLFFVDSEWNVQQVICGQAGGLDRPFTVFTVPDCEAEKRKNRVSVSLQLPHSNWATLSDGCGNLYIVETPSRTSADKWKMHFVDQVLGDNCQFQVIHSVFYELKSPSSLQMECLLLYVEEGEKTEGGSSFHTILAWLTFALAPPSSWSLVRQRRLVCDSTPDFAAVQNDGTAVFVACEKSVKMVSDSLKPVIQEEPTPKKAVTEEPAYNWGQDESEVMLTFTLPPGVTRSQIQVTFKPGNIDVKLDSESLLQGELYADIDVEGSTWTLNDNVLEVTLNKGEKSLWGEVVCGDGRGQCVLTPEQQDALAKSCNQSAGDFSQPAYNTQELEDCDAFPEQTASLMRIHGDEHNVTHQADLGSHQFLFVKPRDGNNLPVLCLRHDVDGLIWEISSPEGDSVPWKHIATFNALGYVHASKQDCRYTLCAPDYSYAAMSDCVRHIYVYRQPGAIATPLRNRKSGRTVDTVAKQHVLNLEEAKNICGLYLSRSHMYVLARKMLYKISINMS